MKTMTMPYKERAISKFQHLIANFISMLGSWAIVLLLLRIGEWVVNGYTHQFPENPMLFLTAALAWDILFICKAGIILFVLFILLSFISTATTRITFIVSATIISLGYFALMQYFNSTLVLLGSDLYGYSAKDIQQTVGASGGLNIVTISLFLLIISLVILSIKWVGPRIRPGKTIGAGLMAGLVAAALLSSTLATFIPSFQKEYNSNLAKNKIDYFISSSWSYFFPEKQDIDIYAENYQVDDGPVFSYVDEKNFPFLHADTIQDVLSPFLQPVTKSPDIVIIVVEGLGRAFTNEGGYLGNFTPFLDSLSQHSLYWKNFLSGGGRTFAVLPTILGSLPFGNNGFNEMENAPKHLSLPAILKKNGYNTSFYYAGDASFDKMDQFLQKQGVDEIRDKKTFPAGYELLPANNGFSWGYGDKELFRFFLDQNKPGKPKPSLDILLTVSTHSPFLIPDQAFFERRFEQRMSALHFTDEQKKEHRAYKQQYATVLYADDALKTFLARYSKRPGYNNTIFIITGDHRMPEIPMSTKIDRYHVPLIVYSPLLTRQAVFQSVSTHFDITPSLLAYLNTSTGAGIPSQAAWLGSGLDTTRAFQNIHSIALKQTKTDLVDFISGDYHLNGDELFRLSENMDEEKVTDPAMKEKLQAAFLRFRQKNDKLAHGAALIPDSLFAGYHP